VSRPGALVVVAGALCACRGTAPPGPAACSAPATLELRDGAGALQLALRGDEVCDAANALVGTVERDATGLTLRGRDRNPILALRGDGADDANGDGARGPRLRLHHGEREWRVLAVDGVPLGAIAATAEGAAVYDPASRPVAAVAARGADQAVRAADGAVRAFVMRSAAPVAAGVFAIDKLTVEEQLAIYLYLTR
jgi:hypothetical protein